ncbi:adenylate/guanylate cyclase domain-containing protein [Croceitalea rosinachiae]|uniref:Adenylate/guanylate cyclase domain-containing protein n=1 Tax=Croceitalea rosinachiae TaxID=3075596 RepID=A0ABU3AAF9_9FLAO|nr:adenylate/guanylate cyclase domain-containing protein [Croceitalea sp. F388]MDT0606873.1 adenylate/guanylate cyclase domain-containing protein [Croceitalea sp. F388]
MSKRNLRILRFYIVGWTMAMIFLAIVRGVGTEELGQLKFDFKSSIIISVTLGPIFGIISGLASIWAEKNLYRKLTLGKLLLLRTLYAIAFIAVMIVAAYWVYQLYFGTDISITTFALDEGSGAIYFYILATDFFMTILRQVNLMLGEGNLSKIIRGQFYTPREEDRIFMFLDLQASTTIAERLGHVRYSMLIQDCFNDLGVAVEQNNAEIYQYVGDEAVLTWPLKEGLNNKNCVNAYYNFSELLEKKKEYYDNMYDCQPFFKAGIHSGVVTVTEVGKYKKEIAYHGDTINTAARIQGKCNALKSEVLLSENLKNEFAENRFTFSEKGQVPLKGKKEPIQIFSIHKELAR